MASCTGSAIWARFGAAPAADRRGNRIVPGAPAVPGVLLLPGRTGTRPRPPAIERPAIGDGIEHPDSGIDGRLATTTVSDFPSNVIAFTRDGAAELFPLNPATPPGSVPPLAARALDDAPR
jgi:hypothetical protein